MGNLQLWRERLNSIPLAVGTGVFFGPVAVFWMRFLPPLRPFDFHVSGPPAGLVALCIALCALPFLIPSRWLRPLPWESGSFYPRLGVRWFRKLAPDGDLVNQYLRQRDPAWRVVRTRADLAAHIRVSYQSERAHLAFFLAGLFTSWFAWHLEETLRAAFIAAANIAYNLYPVMHQRYKRVRLRRFSAYSASSNL